MTFESIALRYKHDAALRQCKQHFPIQRFPFWKLPASSAFAAAAAYLCRQEPCRSSCRRSGRRGARNPPRENNRADRNTPGCSRRRAGPDPPRQRWPGSAAACRSELESGQRADAVSARQHIKQSRHLHTNSAAYAHWGRGQRATHIHKQLQAEGWMRNYRWRAEWGGNKGSTKGETQFSLVLQYNMYM